MTPEAFKAARKRLGLTQSEMAKALRLSDSRAIRNYESGAREISGPVSLCVDLLLLFRSIDLEATAIAVGYFLDPSNEHERVAHDVLTRILGMANGQNQGI